MRARGVSLQSNIAIYWSDVIYCFCLHAKLYTIIKESFFFFWFLAHRFHVNVSNFSATIVTAHGFVCIFLTISSVWLLVVNVIYKQLLFGLEACPQPKSY